MFASAKASDQLSLSTAASPVVRNLTKRRPDSTHVYSLRSHPRRTSCGICIFDVKSLGATHRGYVAFVHLGVQGAGATSPLGAPNEMSTGPKWFPIRPRSVEFRMEELLRSRRAQAGLGDDGRGNSELGRYLVAFRGGDRRLDGVVADAERILHDERRDRTVLHRFDEQVIRAEDDVVDHIP